MASRRRLHSTKSAEKVKNTVCANILYSTHTHLLDHTQHFGNHSEMWLRLVHMADLMCFSLTTRWYHSVLKQGETNAVQGQFISAAHNDRYKKQRLPNCQSNDNHKLINS